MVGFELGRRPTARAARDLLRWPGDLEEEAALSGVTDQAGHLGRAHDGQPCLAWRLAPLLAVLGLEGQWHARGVSG